MCIFSPRSTSICRCSMQNIRGVRSGLHALGYCFWAWQAVLVCVPFIAHSSSAMGLPNDKEPSRTRVRINKCVLATELCIWDVAYCLLEM